MILLVGASASGKTEVAKKLRKDFGIVKVITHTTRKPRVGETNDVDYHFVSVDEFLKMKENNEFVETTFYNDKYYGCSKKEIGNDKCIVVDPNGLKSFNALKDKTIITFFLEAEEDIRRKRMEERGDKKEDIVSRLANDHKFFPKGKKLETDFTIDSNHPSVDEVAKTVYEIYKKELNKRLGN